jgi:hypothetical protein
VSPMPPEKSDRPQPELELLGNQSRLEALSVLMLYYGLSCI